MAEGLAKERRGAAFSKEEMGRCAPLPCSPLLRYDIGWWTSWGMTSGGRAIFPLDPIDISDWQGAPGRRGGAVGAHPQARDAPLGPWTAGSNPRPLAR